jgi:hypothetical protein
MTEKNNLSKVLKNTRINAFFGWGMVLLLFLFAIVNLMYGRLTWSILTIFVISIIGAPAILLRKYSVMPAWYFVILATLPIIGSTTAYYLFSASIPVYLSVATIALLLAAEISWFTSVKMNYKFAILLVIIVTLAMSGLWYLLQWLLDMNLGTSYILNGQTANDINDTVMLKFIYAAISGIVAGIFFGWYFRSSRFADDVEIPILIFQEKTNYITSRPPAPIRKLLGISDEKQKLATKGMQIILLILLLAGIFLKDLSTTINASTGLAITFVPYFITRKYDIPHDTGLTLWITLAVFLHLLGTFAFYENIVRWDNVTHALSACVVAASGYTLIRAIDIYVDEIYIPPRLLFLFILIFVLAMGVIWEIIEFLTDGITTELGYKAILAQHGIHDTMTDLLFDLFGAIIAATWGTAYLSDISYRLADKFEDIVSRRNT